MTLVPAALVCRIHQLTLLVLTVSGAGVTLAVGRWAARSGGCRRRHRSKLFGAVTALPVAACRVAKVPAPVPVTLTVSPPKPVTVAVPASGAVRVPSYNLVARGHAVTFRLACVMLAVRPVGLHRVWLPASVPVGPKPVARDGLARAHMPVGKAGTAGASTLTLSRPMGVTLAVYR